MNDFIKIGLAAAVVALVVFVFARRGSGQTVGGDLTTTLNLGGVQSGSTGNDVFTAGDRAGVNNWLGLLSGQTADLGPFRNIKG